MEKYIVEHPGKKELENNIEFSGLITDSHRYKTDKGEIVALSPICKHLGCTVNWAGDKNYPHRFYCPCHGGMYEKSGKNVPGTPPMGPLDVYVQKEKGGTLYLGKAKPQGGA